MSHVLDLCDEWDRYAKGPHPTTQRIREAYYKDHPWEDPDHDVMGDLKRAVQWVHDHPTGEAMPSSFNVYSVEGQDIGTREVDQGQVGETDG